MKVLAYTASPRKTPESKRDNGFIVPGTGDAEGEFPSAWYSGLDKESLHEFLRQKVDLLVLAVPLTYVSSLSPLFRFQTQSTLFLWGMQLWGTGCIPSQSGGVNTMGLHSCLRLTLTLSITLHTFGTLPLYQTSSTTLPFLSTDAPPPGNKPYTSSPRPNSPCSTSLTPLARTLRTLPAGRSSTNPL